MAAENTSPSIPPLAQRECSPQLLSAGEIARLNIFEIERSDLPVSSPYATWAPQPPNQGFGSIDMGDPDADDRVLLEADVTADEKDLIRARHDRDKERVRKIEKEQTVIETRKKAFKVRARKNIERRGW